jgi:hypothetical protein
LVDVADRSSTRAARASSAVGCSRNSRSAPWRARGSTAAPGSHKFQHGDGRTKLIERLAAAYCAGELPDYMLEFVDSLRTRVKASTS